MITLFAVDPAKDAMFLYWLLGERKPSESISHRAMPSVEDHEQFVASDPYAAWYIIEVEGTQAGAVYLTRNDEIGVHVARRFRHMGIARAAIDALMRMHPKPRYLANINPANERSRRLFEWLGFRQIQHTYELRS